LENKILIGSGLKQKNKIFKQMKNLSLLAICLLWLEISFAVSLSDTIRTNETEKNRLVNILIQTDSIVGARSNFIKPVNLSPLNTLQDILQGRVAGIQIIGQGGLMAQDYHIFFRGNSSLIGNSQPLIVIDGVNPYMWNKDNSAKDYYSINQLHSLSLSDIESIEILKSGYASALYGNEATNGAIVIKT
jgi:TonB-dependent SusC/RagA subfamily outer membrane receptor